MSSQPARVSAQESAASNTSSLCKPLSDVLKDTLGAAPHKAPASLGGTGSSCSETGSSSTSGSRRPEAFPQSAPVGAGLSRSNGARVVQRPGQAPLCPSALQVSGSTGEPSFLWGDLQKIAGDCLRLNVKISWSLFCSGLACISRMASEGEGLRLHSRAPLCTLGVPGRCRLPSALARVHRAVLTLILAHIWWLGHFLRKVSRFCCS